MLKKIAVSLIYCMGSTYCVAAQVPTNSLQVQYQKSIYKKAKNRDGFSLDFSSMAKIPEASYRYLDSIFSSFYHKLTFKTSITDSTFTDNSHYELFSLPLISPNQQGFQLELYGNFSNSSTQYLSNLSADHALYNYIANFEQFDLYNSQLSLGAGFSFNTSRASNLKFIISNGKMPGYGGSTALIGFQQKF
ncbi:hypothetical protein [Psychromonas antarctica]|uniref:hypothetical protein n=1 Tax=Psychromonas antarctica TaxID=67573 RepID=UPI001EE8EAE9|nr:hypothetical protein [Psychromonas antarctica]MCG6202203.1 hypothetical protein [Psychromonas antarctica]